MLVMAIRPLEFTTLVCLRIKQGRHAKAVNSNLVNQLKKGSFENALHYEYEAKASHLQICADR
jgi:hypothetical protein